MGLTEPVGAAGGQERLVEDGEPVERRLLGMTSGGLMRIVGEYVIATRPRRRHSW